ncbi:MAG: Crp/Fnr family transcriptional regulator [Oscillochloris sp.]|nr:Crp/Fnr family transcriptional regulator [Oscillochloris sp.]
MSSAYPEPATLTSAMAALAATPLFGKLSRPLLCTLASAAVRAEYAAQQIIFFAGTPDSRLYVVACGWVKSLKATADGREQTLAVFGPGEVFNLAVLANVVTQVSVVTLEPVTLWCLERSHLQELLAAHPELAQALIGSLATRVVYLSALVEDLALRPIEARLARLILSQARDGQIVRRRWATQAELATQIGTVPDVLNRALRTLSAAGLIAVDRRQIRVIDAAGLEARAQIS